VHARVFSSARCSVARNLAENVFAKMDKVLAPAYETSHHITAVSEEFKAL
jgi:hypothetical protein